MIQNKVATSRHTPDANQAAPLQSPKYRSKSRAAKPTSAIKLNGATMIVFPHFPAAGRVHEVTKLAS